MEKKKDDDDDGDKIKSFNIRSRFRVVLYPELRSLSWRHITVEFNFKDNGQDISASCEQWTYDVIQIWPKHRLYWIYKPFTDQVMLTVHF